MVCKKNKNSTMNDEIAVYCRVAVLVSFSVVERVAKKKKRRRSKEENAHGRVTSDVYAPKIVLYSFKKHQKQNRKKTPHGFISVAVMEV